MYSLESDEEEKNIFGERLLDTRYRVGVRTEKFAYSLTIVCRLLINVYQIETILHCGRSCQV